MPDKNITCVDCKQPFVFTEGEQDFFTSRGFQEPKRCKDCRAKRKNNDSRKRENDK